MIEKMTKYSFILLSGKTEEFLRRLQELGLVDITRSSKPVDERSAALLSMTNELKKAASKLESLDYSQDPDLEKIEAEVDADAKYDNPLESFKEYSTKLDVLRNELAQARKDVESRRPWGCYDSSALDALKAKGYKVRWYNVSKKAYDPSWANLYPLQEVFDDGRNVWFITISDDPAYSLPVEECAAPEGDLRSAERKVTAMMERIITCRARLLELKEYIPEMLRKCDEDVAALQLYLADAGAGKAAEGMITTFIGFAPAENDAALCAEFDKMDIVYLKEEAVRDDNPPIKFKENKLVKMFTVLTDMYGRPAYDEFDPTPCISIFFTLFFAMCMGDAGYGIALAIIGLAMRKAKGFIGSMAPLVTTLGVATIVMGTVLHTFFGMDTSTATWVPDWIKKCMIQGTVAGYDAQMLFSILIGITHISVAMLLKTAYAVKRNGLLNSLGTIGWTLLIVGGVIVGGFALAGVIDSTITKWIVIVLGVVSALGIFLFNDIHRNPLVNIGSGLYETYNTVTGLLGDVLSYLRLYALGLAGGMLGNAFNQLGLSVYGIDVPGVSIPCFVLIVGFGHTLNLAMCCLGAFVHPLRLNFLEFFKNSGYEGTGKAYSPLTTNDNK